MIRLLSRVDAHVALKRLKVAEVRSADLTGVWFLSRVDQHVGAEVGDLVRQETETVTGLKHRRPS